MTQFTIRSRGLCIGLLHSLGLITAAVALASAQQAPVEPEPAQSATEPAAAPVYDGDWWLLLGGQEQYGFVSGYQDCYVSEYHGSVPFSRDLPSYIDDLNKYFLADGTRLKQTVSEGLDVLRGAASDSTLPNYKTANPPPPDQIAYDGHFWSDADPAAKLGFVEGFLACHAAKLKDADAKFSKAPSEYVDRINQAYSNVENAGDTNAGKTVMKIADVLHRLKDSENPPAKPTP